jgi:FixJ family two-component response regulator
MSIAVRAEIEAKTRELLAQRVELLTDKQRQVLEMAYPGGVKEAQLVDAIDLCDRTIAANAARAARPAEAAS